MKIIRFLWKDAYGNGGWFNKRELRECVEKQDHWCWTTGFLIKKTKKYILVCTTWIKKGRLVDEKFCNIHKIPIAWIKDYKVLEEVQ